MDIYLHNTYTNTDELFTPIQKGVVSMYNCGPTVYNYAHIGNMRSFVFADTLRRMFEWNGYTVKQIMNITDVGHLVGDGDAGEDKVEKMARAAGKTAAEVTLFYTDAFMKDLEALSINPAHITFPKATEHIPEQIAMIQDLEEKGFTYVISDGVYFDTAKFPDYGKLGHINLAGLEDGARIGENNEKRNLTDFALWKFSPRVPLGEDNIIEKRQQEWESPWGVGFPGWHIECSAMSIKYLGDEFDIHTGGIDHIPVHHNNEIAQAVCSGHRFTHYWMHNAFLNIRTGNEQVKMAKSGDNFIRVPTLTEQGFDPLAYRYLLLTSHYSSPMEFSFEALKGAETALKRLRRTLHDFDTELSASSADSPMRRATSDEHILAQYRQKFTEYINKDLDIPKALALIWEVLKDTQLCDADKKSLILSFDMVLGLNLHIHQEAEIPLEVQAMILERNTARENKDFALSDSLRTQIESLGFEVLDTSEGTKVEKR
ncbi:MAG: cysteine--tRNA ligase [Candidatus Zambryskibacteria bacterium]|nr:cysteine--tRNA ligase [Candidatus Zambryskibacteria bacterium]